MKFLKGLLYFINIILLATGSRIEFTASPSILKANITNAVAMRCSLTDTETVRSAPVTNTTNDVLHISHILVTKHEGAVSVAEGSVFDAPMALTDVDNLQVKGDISPSSSHGFLELSWRNPSLVEAGDYWCQIQTLNAQHHQTVFKAALVLTRETPTLDDLVALFQTQAQEIKELREKNAQQVNDLHNEIANLKQINKEMLDNHTQIISDLELKDIAKTHLLNTQMYDITSLNQSLIHVVNDVTNVTENVSYIKECQAPKAYFMATLSSTGTTTLKGDENVIYGKAITNIGNHYNTATGVFTADIAGMYAFSASSFVYNPSTANNLNIMVNSRVVTSLVAHTASTEYDEMGFARAVVALTKGDRVFVQTEGGYRDTHTLFQQSTFEINMNTFSGELLRPDSCN